MRKNDPFGKIAYIFFPEMMQCSQNEDLICYLEDYPEITDEDEEIFPEFVVKEGLVFLYSGENFESVNLIFGC